MSSSGYLPAMFISSLASYPRSTHSTPQHSNTVTNKRIKLHKKLPSEHQGQWRLDGFPQHSLDVCRQNKQSNA